MSKAEDVKKLLDNGHIVVLRMCGMGSYLAVSVQDGTEASKILDDAIDTALGWDGIDPVPGSDSACREFEENMPGVVETDDFTIEALLYRITEKATTGRIV